MIQLLPGEEVVASFKGANYEVQLTTWRVVSKGQTLGADAERAIPLDCVDSFFVGTSRHNALLVLGIASFVAFVALKSTTLLALAALLVASWWLFAKRGAHVISRSGKTVILLEATGTNLESVTQFLTATQNALRVRQR